jgi:hypothetical protein
MLSSYSCLIPHPDGAFSLSRHRKCGPLATWRQHKRFRLPSRHAINLFQTMSNSPLPPKIPSERRNSIFHQAATASAFAPLIAVGLTVLSSVGRTGLDPQSQRPFALIVAIVSSIIILIGLICGTVALFGIPRYGKKGILAKALSGIIIPLLLSALAVPNFLAARAQALKRKQYQMSAEGQIQAIADQINRQGKKMVDEATRLEGVEALPNKTLLYNYTLVTKKSSEVPPDALDQIIRPNVVKAYSTHPDMKMLRDNGITLTYRYRDKTGHLIGDFSVGPSDLAK